MTDKEKLIQLIKTGEQCNIDLGVYQWLAQGFDKTELVNEFINRQEFNKCTGWEIYDVRVGNIYFGAYVSDYFDGTNKNPDRDTLFYKFYLTGCFEEYVNSKMVDEHAKYYLRKMLDILEPSVILRESKLAVTE